MCALRACCCPVFQARRTPPAGLTTESESAFRGLRGGLRDVVEPDDLLAVILDGRCTGLHELDLAGRRHLAAAAAGRVDRDHRVGQVKAFLGLRRRLVSANETE